MRISHASELTGEKKMKKIVIVGGVAGGASCAARARRLDENAKIVLFEKGPNISFANCGLPYHIGGVIDDRDELLLQTPESFFKRFNVEVRVESEVIRIDREKKIVSVKHADEVYEEAYDVLVLSPGSSPIKPNIPGIEDEKVVQLWNMDDMDGMIAMLGSGEVKRAAIVGGGFIGLEVAENLCGLGIKVVLIDVQDQVMPNLDLDIAALVHKELKNNGIELKLSQKVEAIEDGAIKTDKELIRADLIVMAVGVRPNTELAADCGLELGISGAISVDDELRTSDHAIYAVGDAVEVSNYISGRKVRIPLAGPANKMGRMAADNINAMGRKYSGTLGSSIAKVFELAAASAGLNEKQLKSAGAKLHEDYFATVIHPLSHAGYYPGASTITVKLLFDANGKILGAQAAGYENVDKCMDILAAAMYFGGTVYDLAELELCYAPPFSSAKSPVNMAGYSAANILNGQVKNILCSELADIDKETVLLDVRTQPECESGIIPGAICIPVDELRERMKELDKSKEYVIYCAVGIRGYIACRILMQNGFENVRNLSGGYRSYLMIM